MILGFLRRAHASTALTDSHHRDAIAQSEKNKRNKPRPGHNSVEGLSVA